MPLQDYIYFLERPFPLLPPEGLGAVLGQFLPGPGCEEEARPPFEPPEPPFELFLDIIFSFKITFDLSKDKIDLGVNLVKKSVKAMI